MVSPWGDVNVRLGVQGDHLIPNALAAASAALPLGVSLEHLAAGLEEPDRSPMRMAMKTAPSGARIIDDTYNANPLSVAGAIEALAAVTAGRKVAVLGVMAELGESSRTDHERMVALAASTASRCCGRCTRVRRERLHVADIEEAEAALGALDTHGRPREGFSGGGARASCCQVARLAGIDREIVGCSGTLLSSPRRPVSATQSGQSQTSYMPCIERFVPRLLSRIACSASRRSVRPHVSH